MVAPASRLPKRQTVRTGAPVSTHGHDLDAPVRLQVRRGRAELLRHTVHYAACRVFEAMDRRPRAATGRFAVLDVDVGRVLRPGVPGAARTDPFRHGLD